MHFSYSDEWHATFYTFFTLQISMNLQILIVSVESFDLSIGMVFE